MEQEIISLMKKNQMSWWEEVEPSAITRFTLISTFVSLFGIPIRISLRICFNKKCVEKI